MNKSTDTTRKLALAAVVAAAYAVLTLVLAPISFSNIQCRVSEVLCILPWSSPAPPRVSSWAASSPIFSTPWASAFST